MKTEQVKMVRLVEMKTVADSTAKVRHILLKFVNKGTDEEVATLTAKADSLKRAYKKVQISKIW